MSLKEKYNELNEEVNINPLVDSRFIIKLLDDAVIAFTESYGETAGVTEVLSGQNRRLRRELMELSNIMKASGEAQKNLLEEFNNRKT